MDTKNDQPPNIVSRRGFIQAGLEKVVLPIVLVIGGGYAGAYFAQRNERQHQLSISVVRSDNAVPAKELSLLETGLLSPPTPTPTPNPNPIYTYTVLIRNNGDFPEEGVTISVAFENDTPGLSPRSGPEFDTSSSLLAQTVSQIEPIETLPNYALTALRLNPGEWLSLKTSWKQAMRVEVDVRSEEIAESSGK